MPSLAATLRSVTRLVVTLACLLGASWGFAAGQHAATHAAAASIVDVGHHHGPSGHHAPVTDDGATTATRRRRRIVSVRLADLTVPAWVALTSRLRPLVRPLTTRWASVAGAPRDPVLLGICRT